MESKERITAFFESFDEELPKELADLQERALEEKVPIIRTSTQSLLRFILKSRRVEKILEIGTAVGFSALFMASNCDAAITTIENYEKRLIQARDNFKRLDKKGQINLLEGDALSILEGLDDSYDLIFIDAAKGQYINYLPHAMRMCSSGGMIIADNIMQDLDILESKFAVRRRDRTIHKRINEYLYEVTHNERLNTILLSEGDGVAISILK